jgi:glycosyltransferase XagB
VTETIQQLDNPNIKIEIFHDDPINKPHALNKGLLISDNTIISVFDAEDEPHPDIYHIVNTLMDTKHVDVVQSGVQLMNYRSRWFSALNCLEYYFWFKSGLHFFNKFGQASPLGGNTVFFKKQYLDLIGGWDENCLTEDADIGFRLIQAGARMHVVYDENHVTKEETPDTLSAFIKQRTRWNQGFLQIFFKFNWLKLPKMRQKFVASYILLFPLLQALLFLYIPIAVYFAFTVKLPILLALFSFLPLFLFFLQITTLLVGFYHFTKSYNLKLSIWMPFEIVLLLYPYLFILAFSSVRAVYRFFFGLNIWEKTAHVNAHRPQIQLAYAE